MHQWINPERPEGEIQHGLGRQHGLHAGDPEFEGVYITHHIHMPNTTTSCNCRPTLKAVALMILFPTAV